jgi:succinoglycan biosynthesis protein ExoA
MRKQYLHRKGFRKTMEIKTVSIVIPVKPAGEVRALAALRELDYPPDAVEILVAEGRCPSRQRNRAAAAAEGEIVFFLDDDSMVCPQYLRQAVSHYSDTDVAAVGGPSLTPDTDPPLRQGFGLVLASLFGSGSVRNRYRRNGTVRKAADNELILCNLSMRADIFRAYRGFDERLYPNEENELLVRINKGGATLLHDPDLVVYRCQRRDLRAFIRQIFGYGSGRARQTLISGVSGYANFVPAAFLIYLCTLPFVDKPVYYLPLLCYLGIAFISACVASARAGKPRLAPLLCCLFPIQHLSYGAGLIWEFISFRFKKMKPKNDEVTLRRIKEFGRQPVK